MSDLSALYQDVILDHNRRPRNFRKLESPDRTCEGFNPLCGDRLTVFLDLEGDIIKDVSFEGTGCAISRRGSRAATSTTRRATSRCRHSSTPSNAATTSRGGGTA